MAREARPFEERFMENMEQTGSPLRVSIMTGKLEDIVSLSTTCKANPLCQEMMKHEEFICSRCFADSTTDRYVYLEEWLESNYKILTERVLDFDELPEVFTLMCRIESFGDLAPGEAGVIQAINYLNFCKRNKYVNIAWWTKHPGQIKKAFERIGMKKPKNLKIVYSSPMIDHEVKWEDMVKVYPFIDIVFTVFSKEYIKKNGIEINCGGRSCKHCKICYFRNNIHQVREMEKRGRSYNAKN